MMRTSKTTKNKKWLASFLGLLFIALMQLQTTENYLANLMPAFVTNDRDSRVLSAVDSVNKASRLSVYTFVDYLSKDEDAVLEFWKDEWFNAGFDPIVLTLEDAKRNPYFVEVEEILAPLHGSTGYGSLCFYRYLAMAMVEGWAMMATHDTFPTNMRPGIRFFRNRMPVFTIYDESSLMIGPGSEWDRVSHLLIETIPNIPEGMSKTVSNALMILEEEGMKSPNEKKKIGILFHHDKTVMKGFRYRPPGKVACAAMERGLVNHISPDVAKQAVTDGSFPIEFNEENPYGPQYRAAGAKIFFDHWRKQCLTKPLVVDKSPIIKEYTRPVIHTFFHSLAPHEDAVLALWKDEWYNAGFDPVVLNLEHAKKNPYFTEVEEILTPLHGSTGYDSLCFYRWLAMAMVEGGGWMTDHDTFPTNIRPLDLAILPRMGAFTSYEGHIPSFMAGSAEEWDRVSHLIIKMIPMIPENMGKSDMHALLMLKEKGVGITGRSHHGLWFNLPHHKTVMQGFRYKSPGKVACGAMKKFKVNHMAHSAVHNAVKDGSFPIELNEEDPYGGRSRAAGVKIFLDQWREQCLSSSSPTHLHKSQTLTETNRSLLTDYVAAFKSKRVPKKILVTELP